MYQTAYNATDGPLVADDFGRTIGGYEFGTVQTTSDDVATAISEGRIHVFASGFPAGQPINPGAAEADTRTKIYNERATALHAASKADVLDLARSGGLVEVEDEPHKNDVIGVLVPRVDIDVSQLAPVQPAATPEAPSDTSESSTGSSRRKDK